MINKWIKRKPEPVPTDLAQAVVQESRKHLRVKMWTDGVKAVVIAVAILFSIGSALRDSAAETIEPHAAVINLRGGIETGSKETDGWKVSNVIREAMRDEKVKAIVIEANSPGGSPVDAEHIYKTIMSYRHYNNDGKPVYVMVRGICASACYYISAAADEIYAQDSSLVGSIGVRMDGWYFGDALDKVGVERRVFHAGEHKALLDPFKQVTDEERAFVQDRLLNKLHQQFIDSVKQGRGERLANNPDIFSGLIWTGEEAVELGLVDAIKTPTELEELIKSRHGVDKFIYHGQKQFKLSSIFSMNADDFIAALGDAIYHAVKVDVKNTFPSMRLE